MATQLDNIYTADEAAKRLRMTQRGIITLGKRYGCCSIHGRDVLFSEQDLVDIWQIMRAPATATKPVTAKAIAFYSTDTLYRDLLRKGQQELEEKRRLRQAREQAAREERLEEKRQAARAKVEARAAKKTAALAAKTKTELASQPLDIKNRDPDYWTPERKELLRLEREARIAARSDKK